MALFGLQSLKTLGLLVLIAIAMRFLSFFPSVIDHDESTYLIIADALLHGDVYFRDVIDTKPIGIFGLFAAFQALFGKSIIALRVITAIWIAVTGWMISHVHRQLLREDNEEPYNPAPLASGIIYVMMTSVFTFFGISPNTELFFTLFTITALFLILRHQGFGWFLLAGLLLGLGFMIKYVVVFDALALGIFYLWQQVVSGKKWSFWFVRCAIMAVGFSIPFGLVWIYYARMGLDESFRFFSFELSGRYFIDSAWQTNLIYALDCLMRYFPVTLWFVYCAWHWRTTGKELPLLSCIWGMLAMIIILIPGKLFYHYFIQFMLPMSLLAGSFFDRRREPGRVLAWMRNPKIGYPLLIIGSLVILYFQKVDFVDKRDYPREVAAWLKTRLQPGDKIYTGNYHQIIYYLTGTDSPTPYIHSSLIWSEENNGALGISREEECRKILDQRPRYIMFNKKFPKNNPMLSALQTDYTLVNLFDGVMHLYERK